MSNSRLHVHVTPARAIKAIVLIQVAIAGYLFFQDLTDALPSRVFPSDAPRLTEPVRPGDQTRRYDPSHAPAGPAGPDVPDTGAMPSRLQFQPVADAPGRVRLTGTVAPGDAARFEAWLETAKTPERVELHSPGGVVTDALAIGRQLRALDAATEVRAGEVCLSACPYILAGGVERIADPDAYIGVHQHYFGESTVLPAFIAVENIQRGQAEVMAYLNDMGVDPLLMRHALATPPDEIYLLLPEERTRYGLVTED